MQTRPTELNDCISGVYAISMLTLSGGSFCLSGFLRLIKKYSPSNSNLPTTSQTHERESRLAHYLLYAGGGLFSGGVSLGLLALINCRQ